MVSREHLAAKIALLSLVNDLPGQPSVAEPPPSDDVALKYELLAAHHLAVISAYSNNPLHVLAVACHEIQDLTTDSYIDGNVSGKRVMIRLAANSGTHDRLLQHLRIIARILQDEASDSKSFVY